VYMRYDPDSATGTLAGNESQLLALFAIRIGPRMMRSLPAGLPWIDIVCATGETATIFVEPTGHEIPVELTDGYDTPQAPLTAGNSWQSVVLPAGTKWIDFGLEDNRAYVVVTASDNQPAQNGCGYAADASHRKRCPGATRLWYKNYTADANAVISWSAYT